MPRPCSRLSALSLCCSTIVRSIAIAGVTTTTSPPFFTPAGAVCTLAVPSPGNAGDTKRATNTRLLAAAIDTWRGFAPTFTLPSVAPVVGFSFSSTPVASSAT